MTVIIRFEKNNDFKTQKTVLIGKINVIRCGQNTI